MKETITITVTLKLFATFRIGREKIQILELPHGTTPMQLYERVGIEASEVKILLVNGRDGKVDMALQEGDVVSIFPPVGGG